MVAWGGAYGSRIYYSQNTVLEKVKRWLEGRGYAVRDRRSGEMTKQLCDRAWNLVRDKKKEREGQAESPGNDDC